MLYFYFFKVRRDPSRDLPLDQSLIFLKVHIATQERKTISSSFFLDLASYVVLMFTPVLQLSSKDNFQEGYDISYTFYPSVLKCNSF